MISGLKPDCVIPREGYTPDWLLNDAFAMKFLMLLNKNLWLKYPRSGNIYRNVSQIRRRKIF